MKQSYSELEASVESLTLDVDRLTCKIHALCHHGDRMCEYCLYRDGKPTGEAECRSCGEFFDNWERKE